METYRGFKLGELSKDKENFEFTHHNLVFVRHSEYAITKLVKEMGLSWVYITRDQDYWVVAQNITQEWIYTPRYY